MVPALILVLAAWCPITTTTTGESTTTTAAPTTTTTATPTTTTVPVLTIEAPHPAPEPATTTTTTTAGPLIGVAAHTTRDRGLPVTGPNGGELVVAGTLLFLGGLLVAATRTGKHP